MLCRTSLCHWCHNCPRWEGFDGRLQWHTGAHQCSVTCWCPMSIWYYKDLCEFEVPSPSLSVKHDFILFFKAWHEKGSTFISHFLLSTTSHLSGHHPGSVDPLCSVFGSWSRTVSVVLHGGTGSQGAATLQEQLHQRAGVYLCVGQMDMLEGYNFGVWLKHTHTHTWSNSDTEVIHCYSFSHSHPLNKGYL